MSEPRLVQRAHVRFDIGFAIGQAQNGLWQDLRRKRPDRRALDMLTDHIADALLDRYELGVPARRRPLHPVGYPMPINNDPRLPLGDK